MQGQGAGRSLQEQGQEAFRVQRVQGTACKGRVQGVGSEVAGCRVGGCRVQGVGSEGAGCRV